MVVKSSPDFFSRVSKCREESLDAAVAPQRAGGDRQILERRQLEGHVARVAGDGGEQLGVAHRQHQRAEAARRLAADGAPGARGDASEIADRSPGSPRA